MPFFNRSNNEDLILAIKSARASRGRNGACFRFAAKALRDNRKDKSGEKLAESEEDLLEHRADGSDAFDTLYIGCEKFLSYHGCFVFSVSGILYFRLYYLTLECLILAHNAVNFATEVDSRPHL